jgi:hypothetical protein
MEMADLGLAVLAAAFPAVLLSGTAWFVRNRRHRVLLTSLPGSLLVCWVLYRAATIEIDEPFRPWLGAVSLAATGAAALVACLASRVKASFWPTTAAVVLSGFAAAWVVGLAPPIVRHPRWEQAMSRPAASRPLGAGAADESRPR